MTQEALVATVAALPAGEARFIRPSESKGLIQQCERDGYITVDLPELRAALRGRLAWLLEEAIERTLELRGACRSGIGDGASLESSLTDQLYRARLIGARGLTLLVPTLDGITNRVGALDPEDSATLRSWIGAARRRPVRLYLDVADCMLGAYLDPVTLTQLMQSELPGLPNSPPLVVEWVDDVEARRSDNRFEVPHEVALHDQSSPPSRSDVVTKVENDSAHTPELQLAQHQSGEFSIHPAAPTALEQELPEPSACAQSISLPPDTALELPALLPSLPPPRALESLDAAKFASPNGTEHASDADDSGLTPLFAPSSADLRRSSPLHDPPETRETSSLPTLAPPRDPGAEAHVEQLPHERELILPSPHPPTIPAPRLEQELAAAPPGPTPAQPPLHEDAPRSWRTWMERLDAVHGPKPLNFIEQSFVEHYVPLYDAYHRGIAGQECRSVLDQWATSFSQSYSEAFDAMRLRGRRPMMVLDIAETAHRLGRLHGARAVQLVLVDGMRYDLGLRVERLLSQKLAREAVLTDRFLLWSALPSTTTQQLELLARPESLRDGDVHTETPVLVARGRSASTLRRVRVGSRELLKLDLVEARLNEPGGPVSERLDQLALEVADALALALAKLQPRTLVTVFGDHGFCLDAKDAGTTTMRQGGASPDEVLVPAFAWLVGQMH